MDTKPRLMHHHFQRKEAAMTAAIRNFNLQEYLRELSQVETDQHSRHEELKKISRLEHEEYDLEEIKVS